jgi:hypothetical protein
MSYELDPDRPPHRPIPDADLGYLPLVVAIVAVFFGLWLVSPRNEANQRVSENVPRSAAPSPAPKNTPAPTLERQK